MDKMATLQRAFTKMGMLARTTSSYVAQSKAKDNGGNSESDETGLHPDDDEENEDDNGGPVSGSPSGAMSQVKLASKCGIPLVFVLIFLQNLATLAIFINLLNKFVNPSFCLLFAAFSSCTTTQTSKHLPKSKICLCLKVKSMFITLLLQYTTHQVIYVEQVAYIVSEFSQHHLSMGMNAVIPFLWFLTSHKSA